MSISTTPTSIQFGDLISKFEASKETVYDDGRGIATIGIGLNIEENADYLALVLRTLGVFEASDRMLIGPESESQRNARYEEIIQSFSALIRAAPLSGKSTAAEDQLRIDLGNALKPFVAYGARSTFSVTGPEARALVESVFDGFAIAPDLNGDKRAFRHDTGKAKRLNDRLTSYGISLPPDSREYLVLKSLFYAVEGEQAQNADGSLRPGPNSFDSKALVGNGLLSAIRDGKRAEAWYEIRYNSNGGTRPVREGTAARRFQEAQLFGLYDDPTSLSEAKGVYEMLTNHRDDILAYEALYGEPPDGSSAHRDMIEVANGHYQFSGANHVQSLSDALTAARDRLISWLNMELPQGAAQLVPSEWNPAAIYYSPTPGGTRHTLVATPDDGKGGAVVQNLENNILVGGDGLDTLVGGAGNDVLIGGAGADTLVGGAGSDSLYGGEGNDIYVWSPSTDGVDTIIDPDGGTLFIVDSESGSKHVLRGTFLRQAGSGQALTWIDATGEIVLTHNSPWRITLSDGSVIQLGDDFDPSAWGISLQEQPDASTSTLAGDFIKATSGSVYVTDAYGYDSVGNQPDTQDVINGGAASETIQGLGGNDGLAGGDGDDVIDGGAGDDLILGGWGADTISGGDGNDEILGSAFGRIDRPTSTNFTPPAASGTETARGFSWVIYDSPDGVTHVVAGTTGIAPNGETVGNIIDGGAGTDRIGAGTGDDIAHGGADDDVVLGMGGHDVLFGDAGADQIWGDGFGSNTSGWYTPYSEHGNDTLFGGVGNDVLSGQGGRDFLFGEDGDDQLIGDDTDEIRTPSASHGIDYLDGGSGNDSLWGGGGNDSLFGGAGNDTLVGDAAGLDVGYHGSDYLDGGDGNDTLSGDGGDDWLAGGAGDDFLQGDSAGVPNAAHGKDLLDGGLGDDTLVGGGGSDTLRGDEGNDQLHGDASSVAMANQGDDILAGGAGDDELVGYGGNDTLIGGAGVDSLSGGDGDDTYVFDAGDAVVSAQLEADTIADSVGDNVVQINEVSSNGISLELSANGGALVLLYDTNERVAVLLGSSVSFDLDDGRFSFSELIGSRAAGAVNFSDGINTFLIGGFGNDSLLSSGSATLSGGRGSDVLTGTGGFNTYSYSVGDGSDHIVDTSAKTDAQGLPTPNTLRFGSWITKDDLRLGVASGSLTISVGWDPSDVVYIDGFDVADALSTHPIDRFEFTNGTVLTYTELLARGIDIVGTSGNDTLTGTSVDDRIDGGAGNDALSGGAGSDTYKWGLGAGQDTINNADSSSGSTDTLWIASDLTSADVIFSRNGNDLLVRSRTTSDSVTVVDHFNGAAIDAVAFDDGTIWDSIAISAHLSSELTGGNDVFTGTSADDLIAGLGGNDTISGGFGNDLIEGNDGNDTLNGDAGDDTLDGGGGSDNLYGGTGSDTYRFGRGSGADRITEVGDTTGIDAIQLSADVNPGDVTLSRSSNDLLITINGTTDQLTIAGVWAAGASAAQRIERIEFSDGTVWTEPAIRQILLHATSGADSIDGFVTDDVLHGLEGNDQLRGSDGADTIYGDEGGDTLYGQNGDDVLDGGVGNDVHYAGAGSDTILFGRGMGTDTVYSDDSAPGSVDRIIFAADVLPTDIKLAHNSQDALTLTISPSPGYTGSSTVLSLPQFFANNGAASVDEFRFADGTVWTYADITARLLAQSTDLDDWITGFGGADVMTGFGGDDILYGDKGADTLYGGSGDDRLYGEADADVLYGDAGNDRLFGDADADALYGDAGDDQLDGGDGADILDGATGTDGLTGGLGDDVYRFGRGYGQDTIQESTGVGSGNDTLELAAGISTTDVTLHRNGTDLIVVLDGSSTQAKVAGFFAATAAQIEQIRFADATTWDLAAINARVVGGTANSMSGTAGNDTFTVDNTLDTVTEGANQGTDTVLSSVDWTLGSNVENLTLLGPLHLAGSGNSLANVLIGSDGDNKLISAEDQAADILEGGKGNDTYYIDGLSYDTVIELAGEGIDTIVSDRSYNLTTNVENIVYSGRFSWMSAGLTFRGNAADNVLDGRAYGGDTFLDGGQGVDTMIGSTLGRTVFTVDNAADVVSYHGNSPDWNVVITSTDYALPLKSASGLDLAAGSLATVGTGNDLNNVIRGNERDNILYGQGGNDVFYSGFGVDTLLGGTGDDTYYLDWWATLKLDTWLRPTTEVWSNPYGMASRSPSTIVEASDEGTDTVVSSFDYTLPANVENLTLTANGPDIIATYGTGNDLDNRLWGNSYSNVLDGGAGNDTLDGNGGNDVLIGGIGDDIYQVTDGDTLIEAAGGGVDTIESYSSYSLLAQFENLTLKGSGDDVGVGNAADNVLDGTGSAGANQLTGGLGNDTYRLGVGDVAIELAGEGFDTVESVVDCTLGDNIERLVLVGSAAVYGTGSSHSDVLDGSRSQVANVLTGLDGDDSYVVDSTDIVMEASGGGADTVTATGSYTLGANIETLILYGLDGTESINGTGNGAANLIIGNDGDNVLDGGAGADIMRGGNGDDTYFVDDAGDVVEEDGVIASFADVVMSSISYTLTAGIESLGLTGSAAITGTGNSFDNRIDGSTNAAGNTLVGGLGNDTYIVGAGDVVIEKAGEGTDSVLSDVSYTLSANVETLTLTGVAATNATGNSGTNLLTGNDAENVLDGRGGADTMIGGLGDDTYVVDDAGDVIVELATEGNDTVRSSIGLGLAAFVENLILTGTNAIGGTGNALDNRIDGSQNSAANVLTGGAGNDTYIVGSNDTVVESAGEGIDSVESATSYTLGNNLESLTLTGWTSINGTGNALSNTLNGNRGDNNLDGGAGADQMAGGLGDDTYVVDDINDLTQELTGEGIDTVQSSVAITLASNVENLTLIGSAAIAGTGNSLDNVLVGNSAANVLTGGAGNDTYVVGAGDSVVEAASAGTDTVRTDVDWVLGSNVENLTLTGSAAINGTGNTLANQITGNTGANVLNGGTGADQMSGGLGDDTYVVDNAGDIVTETAGQGTDLVQATVTHTLTANVENLTLTGSSAINATGNALDNVITGNSAVNVLDGGLGADSLVGGGGNDTYIVDYAGDVIVENAGEGTDLVQSNVSYTLAANVENLTLTGVAAISGTGNDLANVLTGNAAANVLAGGLGNDTYVVDNVGDVIVESAGEGTDLVQSSVSYALAANVDNLTLTGTGATNATGNDLVNTLAGNASDNVLDGGLGADTLVGGAGNDTYFVTAGDTVTEGASAGTDLVIADVTWTLATNVENLTLTGVAAVNGTGNTLANVITGNAAANVLDGGTGADQLVGGLGDDTYVIDNAGDVITELAGEGTDLVKSSIAYTLGATLENLTLTGTTAINATGNALNNRLDGSTNTAANVLTGGVGDDTYVVGTGDTIVENAGEGTDAVLSAVTYTLAANVENLTLTGTSAINGTGNALNNAVTGNTGANVLDGGAGADTLAGGLGNDTYVVDNAGDAVIEGVGEGTDLVQSSIAWTLGANSENLTLTGASAINGTGNDLANTLTGNSADNVLDGGLGSDTLVGGTGNDTYVVSTGDTVTEAASAGTDTVVADVSWTLGSNLENLTLSGVAAINGTGNTLANVIIGNSAANVLDGGTGADQLSAGAGDDVYVVDNAADVVTELAAQGTDLVQSSIAWTLGANVENLTLTGSGVINGAGNALDNVLTGNSAANVLTGGAGNDTYVVGTGDTVTESAGEGTDTVQSSITWTLGSNIENLTLTGATAINGTGNAVSNVIVGNSAANVLDGGTGADTLTGGAGNDTYVVDDVGDAVLEVTGEGTDLVNAGVSYSLSSNVENLTLTGTATINATGNALDNVLTGNTAVNTLTGGTGNDTYVVTAGDVVVENAGEGTDTVQSAVTWTLGANIENLTLTGTTAVNGTGNALANVMTGNSAANVLTGGAGNDTYVVGTGDTVTENAGEGTDTVQSSVTWTLSNNIENLTLTGSSAINGTGNAIDNVLVGNTGNNTLTGAAGNDTLVGGAGNDIYVVDSALDVTTENAGEGTDTVQSAIAWTLAANIENLTLTGTAAVNGTGNTLDNVLTGNSAVNTLTGGAGNDTYVVTAGDAVVENVGEGTDTVQSAIAWTLGANIENLTLTGTTAVNGTGNALDNVLTGNSAVNTLTGGAGNDTYVVTAGDVLVENAGEGTDTVQSAVAWTLGSNIENLTLTGSSAVNGTGNTLDNVLLGNTGNNTLTGGAGNDTLDGGTAGTDSLVGGIGNDTYVIGRTTGIAVSENASEGIDAVSASVTYTLGANIELLFQTGATAINGTGNALANLLRGNAAANSLVGGGGTDILEGGDGNDVLSNIAGNTLLNGGLGTDALTAADGNDLLIGGVGNDSITTGLGADIVAFNKGDGSDTIAASTSTDNTLSIGGGATYADLLFQKSGTDLILKVGATDQITFVGYYSGSNRSVSTLQMVIEGTADYLPGGGDVTRDNKIETFNFAGLVAAFDAALVANPALTSWSLTNGLASQYLAGSDSSAIGGDLAYRYNRFGNLSDVSYSPAIGILSSGSFGATSQALQALASLQDSTARLS